jgi:hypothetical protein
MSNGGAERRVRRRLSLALYLSRVRSGEVLDRTCGRFVVLICMLDLQLFYWPSLQLGHD